VTTADFVALAERVSGRQLDGFFRTWLYTPAKPGT
jgi:aminopeptidase N